MRRRKLLSGTVILYQITAGTASISSTADVIQIREPGLSARQLSQLVREVKQRVTAKVLVNDRTDVALCCGADGVHLRANSIAPVQLRAITPPGFIISVSCHSEEDVIRLEGADYALLAPVFKPLSKADQRKPLGLAALERIARRSRVPVLALGGITPANTASCLAAGAAGVAGITLFRRS